VRRGAYVTEMSRDDVAQVYHVRRCWRRRRRDAAERASDAELAQLQALHDGWRRAGAPSHDAFFAANEAFHLACADRRQPLAPPIVADLRKVMKLNRHHSAAAPGRLAESLANTAR